MRVGHYYFNIKDKTSILINQVAMIYGDIFGGIEYR